MKRRTIREQIPGLDGMIKALLYPVRGVAVSIAADPVDPPQWLELRAECEDGTFVAREPVSGAAARFADIVLAALARSRDRKANGVALFQPEVA